MKIPNEAYLLYIQTSTVTFREYGLVSSIVVANKWLSINSKNRYKTYKLNDPELLSRIAKGEVENG